MSNFISIKNPINSFNSNISVAGDKSLSIRWVLLSSMAIGKSKAYGLLESDDVKSSLKAVSRLGIRIKKTKNHYEINGVGINNFLIKKNTVIDAGNSGTLARLILGVLAGSEAEVKVIGDKSLSKRDFERVIDPLKKFGVKIINKKKGLPLKILGSNYLRPINYLERIGSAQCKSCVMLAALNTDGKTKIKAEKSRDHTEILFKKIGVPIKIKKTKKFDFIEVTGKKNFNSFDYIIPGDISSSSFFIALTLLSKDSKLIIKNININKTRTGIIDIIKKMKAKIKFINRKSYMGEKTADIVVKSSSNLKSIDCPSALNSRAIDEFLIIFLLAAKSKGISFFRNLEELNQKESPRLKIAINFLKMLGIKVVKNKNIIKIYGNPNLKLNKSYVIKNFRMDHRVFMMSTIAALTLGGNWKIYDKESIKTSFPSFLKILKKLGAKFN
tara:strand:+ start:1682 stop:3007 length:1326 start_codon:yes stop_codon:yes gene_type:complete